MLRKIITLVFLAAFAMQSFGKVVIVTDYYVNTKVYAQNCENKDKPRLHCNGKCQMGKKLKEEQKKEDHSPERKAEGQNVLSSQSFFPTVPVTRVYTPKPAYSELKEEAEVKSSPSIFRPPDMRAAA